MTISKFHTLDLAYALCAGVSLIADDDVAFASSVFVGGTVVTAISTDVVIAGDTVVIALVKGVFSFLLSLTVVLMWAMIDVVVDLQKRRRRKETE